MAAAEYRRTSFAGSLERDRRLHDPHYRPVARPPVDDLDRDYDDYPPRTSVARSRTTSPVGAKNASSKRQLARPDPRAHGSGRQRRRACRHRRSQRRRPHHPHQVRPRQRRRPPFAELLGHRPGRGRQGHPRRSAEEARKRWRDESRRPRACSSARTRAKPAPRHPQPQLLRHLPLER